ncbi:hypothetical protein HW115_19070 [Verrucomicrobiaceae bacterium N1E253]|uniref:Uncharacterized protein n=1 Tax=Oceaniferula marina TaxID=2748318 RepID=A0A851GIU2_9BACT|nr:hypothetical protein [Oceaniferula marina]NWK57728.1 hypothetical protein [Oceaniferula marina]
MKILLITTAFIIFSNLLMPIQAGQINVTAQFSNFNKPKKGKTPMKPLVFLCVEGEKKKASIGKEMIFPTRDFDHNNKDDEVKNGDFVKRDLGMIIEVTVSKIGTKFHYKGHCIITDFEGMSEVFDKVKPVTYGFRQRECFFYGFFEHGKPIDIPIGDPKKPSGILHLIFKKK